MPLLLPRSQNDIATTAREEEEEERAAEEARIRAAGLFELLLPPSVATVDVAERTTEASRLRTLTLPSSNPTAALAEGQWRATHVGIDGGCELAAKPAAEEAFENEGERA